MSPHTIQAEGNTLRNCLSGARKILGLKLKCSRVREKIKIGPKIWECGPNVWRVTLATGDVVVCTLRSRERGQRCCFRLSGAPLRIFPR